MIIDRTGWLWCVQTGGNFNLGNSKSDLDIRVYVMKDNPGPGQYAVPDPMDEAGKGTTPTAREIRICKSTITDDFV